MSTAPEVEASEPEFAVVANARLSGLLGVASAVLAIAYFARAIDGGFVAALATLIFGAIAAHQLWTVFDGRIELVTADEHGVRVRLHREWLGLPWSTIEQIVVEHHDGVLRDGRMVIVPRNLGNAIEMLPRGARRAVAWQTRLHGAPLAVPLSIATRTLSEGSAADVLRSLSRGRADIVVMRGRTQPEAEIRTSAPAPIGFESAAHPSTLEVQRKPVVEMPPAVAAARGARPVNRTEVVREKSRQMPGVIHAAREAAADVIAPVAAPRVDAAWSGNGVIGSEPLRPHLIATPVIGPIVRAARERAKLSVDELSERTTIRPHVIEGIEVDDFSACGGDFYARGHLRTLARFLGLNPGDLVAKYDDSYARAPISARRVFEAELATSLGTGVRVRSGGPRWSLIAAAVLALMMVWGVARFLAPQAAPVNSAALAGSITDTPETTAPITSPLMKKSTVVLGSLAWSTEIVVSTVARAGYPATIVWQGALRSRATKTVEVTGPFTITASQATLTTVSVNGVDMGKVGMTNGSGARSFN